MRAHDWSTSPLGLPEGWPNGLKVAMRLLLGSRFDMWLGWGPDIAFFYNDAYRPTLGNKHPRSLGMPTRVLWAEIWPDIEARLRGVYERGESSWDRALLLLLERHGYPEETYHTFSYSPLLGDSGQVEGVFCAVTEDTDRVISERRLDLLRQLASGLGTADSRAAALAATREALGRNRHDLLFSLVYLFEPGERTVLACAIGIDASHRRAPADLNGGRPVWDLSAFDDQVDHFVVDLAADTDLPTGAWQRPPAAAVIVPLVRPGSDHPRGALIVGLNPHRPFDNDYLGFVKLLAGQLAASLANAEAYEAERQRALALADAVQLRQQAADALQALNATLERRVAERTEALAVALDRLQREAAEREVMEAALRHAQRMESMGALTGGIAHDFNNLLQVISSNLQLLGRHVAGNAQARTRVENALAGVGRGAKLASQLLAFGRRQPLAPKVVNIARLLHGMDDMLRRALGEEIELQAPSSDAVWNCLIDPAQIENAVLNLAINARDAMPGGGRLKIEAINAVLDEAYALVHADVRPGPHVALVVSDTGTGMSPDVLDRAFEPFFSTKPEGKGTGLGLSMVYGFVKQSGGHLKIESVVGVGTTVRLYLPRVHQAEDDLSVASGDEVPAGHETVLVVEDDEAVREAAIAIITDLGYRVHQARNAAEALQLIESGVPIDILFTDVVMPGPLRSPELARRARARLPQLAVLFTSGYTEDEIMHGGRLDAGVELLSKPYTRDALGRQLRHVLGLQSPDEAPTHPN